MAASDIITEPGVFIPILISIILPFILIAVNKFSRTSESTLSGTIKLEAVRCTVNELKESLKNGFEKLENLINKKDEEHRSEFIKVWNRLEEMNTNIKLNTYRIDDIQRKKDGGPI